MSGIKNVSALALNSNRISASVVRLNEDGEPFVTGLGKFEGRIMGSSGVLDIDRMARGMKTALSKAFEESGDEPKQLLLGVSGASVSCETARGIVKIGNKNGEITKTHLREVMKIAEMLPVDRARQILHSIPQDFILDGQDGIANPLGLAGMKLETETLLVTAYAPFIQNVTKALNLAGKEARDIIFSVFAVSDSVFERQDKPKGVALLEIDDAFTSVSFFYGNLLRGLKVERSSAISEGALERLSKGLDKMRGGRAVSEIILLGGSYVHEDFVEKVNRVFGIPSRMAYLRQVKGSAKDISSPAHIPSISLCLYGLVSSSPDSDIIRQGLLGRARRRLGEFIEEYF